jgi:pimeloyl-ACP methyl ester carboxylesterase
VIGSASPHVHVATGPGSGLGGSRRLSVREPSAYYADLWRRRDRLRGRPILVVWGFRDPAFRPHILARWVELFGPAARTVRLPAVGHWPHEEAPDVVRDELVAFLEAT